MSQRWKPNWTPVGLAQGRGLNCSSLLRSFGFQKSTQIPLVSEGPGALWAGSCSRLTSPRRLGLPQGSLLVALRPPPLDHGALEGGPRLARSSSRAAQCRRVTVCVSGQGRRPPGFSLPSTRAPWSLSREGTSLPAIPPHTCQSPLCGENPLDSDASRKSTSALCWEMKMLKENYVFHRQSKSFFSLLSVWIRGSLFLWEHLNFPVF